MDESDSNDSVFSTDGGDSGASSANGDDHLNAPVFPSDELLINGLSECSRIELRDIYLGGSCMVRTRWRQDHAIPYLKSIGISYYLPTLHENICKTHLSSLGDANADPNDFCSSLFPSAEQTDASEDSLMYNPLILDSSRVLLFVITNKTRSLAPMTLAAHCIGLGYNVVLCVQMLPERCTIGHDLLTPSAIKDYNRGRSYLIDLAKRQEIPYFNEIQPALRCAIDKVRVCKSRNSV